MSNFKIGVRLSSLGLPIRKGLVQAQKMGAQGVMIDASGDLSPTTLGSTGRRELRNLFRSENLELTAVGCPLRHGLATLENQQQRIDYVREVMKLSYDLGVGLVVIHAGRIPEDPESPAGIRMTESMTSLAHFGDHVGAVLALETGLESGEVLRDFLARFDSASLGVNLDPANLLLHGFDIFASVQALKGLIVHSDAKDARVSSASRASEEVALGHGDIDWMTYLSFLDAVGYRGWITLERETGDHRIQDMAEGIGFLRRFLP